MLPPHLPSLCFDELPGGWALAGVSCVVVLGLGCLRNSGSAEACVLSFRVYLVFLLFNHGWSFIMQKNPVTQSFYFVPGLR